MATNISAQHHQFVPLGSSSGNLVPLFGQTKDTDEQDIVDAGRLLQLTNHLQTSLSLEEVLTLFSEEVAAYVPHDFLGYKTEANKDGKLFDFKLGKKTRNKLDYQLSINSKALGTLVIARKRKFSDAEANELEQLVSALLYPLRNALLYKDALQAAQKDGLTGVCNRAAFDEVLSREVELALRHDRSLGMIIIDIDHFKSINDTYGHSVGDCLLRKLTKCAAQTIRHSDQLFRYGGEEFVVLLPETNTRGVKRLAERIRRNIENLEPVCEDNQIRMTASLGYATLQYDENEADFFSRADKALYEAKEAGRNCTRFAD
ncbi:GGDEF domain-containing protein [Kaarinaea lacus]